MRRGLPRRFGDGAPASGLPRRLTPRPRPICFASNVRRSEYAGAMSGWVARKFQRAR